ncbi:MAG: uroporphyrinogen decarboxylase family protein [Victivallaceae bacterium]|nr:uroporphyrinogen decarboxylase family protein [Victivallaceae bacterium]
MSGNDYFEAERLKHDLDMLWSGKYPGHVVTSYKIDLLKEIDHLKYHTDKQIMFETQMRIIETSQKYRCPFCPSVWPDLGVVTIPSGFGSKATFVPHDWPAIIDYAIDDINDVGKLRKPDFYKDGFMPYVLDCLHFLKEKTGHSLPVGICDVQAPVEAAFQVCKYENFLTATLLEPEKAADLVALCYDTIIDFIKCQKEIIGQELNEFYGFNRYYIPKGNGGIYATQDFAAVTSASVYRKFGFPYAEKLFKQMGGGIIHNCGKFEHNIENLKDLPAACFELCSEVVDPVKIYEKFAGKKIFKRRAFAARQNPFR